MGLDDRIDELWSDGTWRYPIISGLSSMPFVIAIQHMDIEFYSVVPPFLAGFVAGLWAVKNPVSSTRIGWRAGVVGGLSLAYGGLQFLFSTSQIWFSSPPLFVTIFTPIGVSLVILAYIVIYGIIGSIGGMLGNWIWNNFGRTTNLTLQ
ncbi:DUF5518 domain-containing protein [Natrinema versiforme]|uniref:DUF5518 domain-containing protein n=1 Tax=Natrinema versiforme TaxID=88724 RepID=A0A4P8WK76_9EURY|nr:DUF5518 domain-containing protein [Natrinema versiforme]QCS42321.1 hypothetical protein FEJ81_08090 [Natrinema versiforme]